MMIDLPNSRVWVRPFTSPEEYHSFLENLQFSRLFNLRYRGLIEFYGEGLIEYARKKVKKGAKDKFSKACIDFLQVFGCYFTDYLENNCPATWEDCREAFWEEFIFAYYPYQLKLGEKPKQMPS